MQKKRQCDTLRQTYRINFYSYSCSYWNMLPHKIFVVILLEQYSSSSVETLRKNMVIKQLDINKNSSKLKQVES